MGPWSNCLFLLLGLRASSTCSLIPSRQKGCCSWAWTALCAECGEQKCTKPNLMVLVVEGSPILSISPKPWKRLLREASAEDSDPPAGRPPTYTDLGSSLWP